MTNKLNRSLKIVTLASATVMLMIGAADARTYSSKTSIDTGTKAVCLLETYRGSRGLETNARISCEITDTEADGSTPYVLWQIDGYRERRINGSGPKDKVVQRVDSAGGDDGITRVRFRACRDRSFRQDNCDYYETWNVN